MDPITADTGNDTDKDTSGSESGGNSDYVSAPKNLRGVARAQRGFLDDLAECLANRESDAAVIRPEIWRSIVSLNAPGATLSVVRVILVVQTYS